MPKAPEAMEDKVTLKTIGSPHVHVWAALVEVIAKEQKEGATRRYWNNRVCQTPAADLEQDVNVCRCKKPPKEESSARSAGI